jgi:hypothetical protein
MPQTEELETRLRDLSLIVKFGWVLLVSAFTIGVWVTTIQITLNAHSLRLNEAAQQRTNDLEAIRALEIKDSSDTQLLRSIVEKLDRIDKKLNP